MSRANDTVARTSESASCAASWPRPLAAVIRMDTDLGDAANRFAAAEIRALERRAGKAAEDHAKWCEFAKGIYQTHESYIKKTLEPIASAWRATTGETVDVARVAEGLCAARGPVFDATCNQTALLSQWKFTRAFDALASLERAFFHEAL